LDCSAAAAEIEPPLSAALLPDPLKAGRNDGGIEATVELEECLEKLVPALAQREHTRGKIR
jgi:hypothetical protein